jgi:hypothetical protein
MPARGRLIIRAVAVIAVGSLVFWAVLGVTLVGITRRASPAFALSWHAADSAAQAELADALIAADLSNLARAGRLAQASLERSPLSVKAARILAMVRGAGGDEAAADRLLAYASRLSRRDFATELLLIERNVRSDNIAGALEHYDIALRSSPDAGGLLLPIMVRASEQDAITDGLIELVDSDPPWLHSFMAVLIGEGRNLRNVTRITNAAIGGRTGEQVEQWVGWLLTRQVGVGDYGAAFATYSRATRRPPGLVRDGSFEGVSTFPPIDWLLTNEPDLAAATALKPGGSGDLALFLTARAGRGGEVARQLLGLRPGSYALAAEVGDVPEEPADRPYVLVNCAGGQERQLLRLNLPQVASGAVRIRARFDVPPNACGAQWIRIVASSSMGGDTPNAWIDSIAVHPQR